MTTFTASPSYSVNMTKAPRVRKSQFGDGYQQRVADGINTISRAWNLVFKGNQSEIEAIESFFVTEGGITSFDWTPPTGSAGKFIAEEWNLTVADYNNWSISVTFNEVFGE